MGNGIGWIDRNRDEGAAAGRLAVVAVALELRRSLTAELHMDRAAQTRDIKSFHNRCSLVYIDGLYLIRRVTSLGIAMNGEQLQCDRRMFIARVASR